MTKYLGYFTGLVLLASLTIGATAAAAEPVKEERKTPNSLFNPYQQRLGKPGRIGYIRKEIPDFQVPGTGRLGRRRRPNRPAVLQHQRRPEDVAARLDGRLAEVVGGVGVTTEMPSSERLHPSP